MGKSSLHKFGWYSVWLCGVGGVGGVGGEVSGETIQTYHILIALFITRIHKEFKQALPYQLTSEKP